METNQDEARGESGGQDGSYATKLVSSSLCLCVSPCVGVTLCVWVSPCVGVTLGLSVCVCICRNVPTSSPVVVARHLLSKLEFSFWVSFDGHSFLCARAFFPPHF